MENIPTEILEAAKTDNPVFYAPSLRPACKFFSLTQVNKIGNGFVGKVHEKCM